MKSNLCPLAISVLTLAGSTFLVAAGYNPVADPANIAPTPLTMPSEAVVEGQPRNTKGHPNTLWDQQDIDAIKKQLTTNADLQKELQTLKEAADKRISLPLNVPEGGGPPPERKDYWKHADNAKAISDLGVVYALTGDEKYGDYAKRMLVAYAKAYPTLPHPADWTTKKYRSALDGRLTGQFLEDGFWLARVAWGADLVYNVSTWTEEERKLVKENLLEAVSAQFYDPVMNTDATYINSTHNRSALCTSAVLMAGYASDNEKLVNIALYGNNGTADNPVGGVLGTHFTDKCIFPDGLWNEGAPGYQLGIASSALMNDAVTLWHHDIDLYRFNNSVLKRLLDSPIGLAYPTPRMDVPLLHDSGALAMLDDRDWFSNEAGMPYMYGYERYKDPAYIPIIRNASKKLSMNVHAGPPSLFLDLPGNETLPPRPIENANYYSVGYGVLRVPAAKNYNQLLMEFGASGSHGHPSKLGIDLFALDDVLMPFPGVIFPYQDPMDPKWYWTTLGNCALVIDQGSQITQHDLYKQPKGTPNPEAKQLLFGPGRTFGIQRAWSDNLYPDKIPQDRALFLTKDYMADLYAVSSDKPRQYELVWHFRGELSTPVPMESFTFPEPVPNGYNGLTNVKRGQSNEAWSAAIKTPNGSEARFFSAGESGTEIFSGNGHLVANKPGVKFEEPPTLIERRKDKTNALFGSAIDISGTAEPYIRKVEQEGGLEKGYALLKVETRSGTDLCFASYQTSPMEIEGLSTDALQAFVVHDASGIGALYLGGGTRLKSGDAEITRSEKGLASIEKLANGNWLISNPSPKDATVTVKLPGLEKLAAFAVARDGSRQKKIEAQIASGKLSLLLPAASQAELATP